MQMSYLLVFLTATLVLPSAIQASSSSSIAPKTETKEVKGGHVDEVKGNTAHFLSGKTVTVTDLGAIQSIYMGPTDGVWQRSPGSSGVLSFGKKVRGDLQYPHITFGKDCINGVVAVHYSLSSTARVQFSYDLITGIGPTHIRNEGTIPPGQQEVAQTKVATFMEKFKAKVDKALIHTK